MKLLLTLSNLEYLELSSCMVDIYFSTRADKKRTRLHPAKKKALQQVET